LKERTFDERLSIANPFHIDKVRTSIHTEQRSDETRGSFPAHDRSGEGGVLGVSDFDGCDHPLNVFSKNPDKSDILFLHWLGIVWNRIVFADTVDNQLFSAVESGNQSERTLSFLAQSHVCSVFCMFCWLCRPYTIAAVIGVCTPVSNIFALDDSLGGKMVHRAIWV